jgi:hypothetical protein
MRLRLYEKLFEKAFPKDISITSEKEFYGRVRFFGHSIAKEMLTDFKNMGWIESTNRGERIYNKKSGKLF